MNKRCYQFNVQRDSGKFIEIKIVSQKNLRQWKVWLATPTLRTNNGKATLTVSPLVNHLLNINIDVIDNRNIKNRHLSRKGPHVNDSGSKLWAKFFLKNIESFWVHKGCSSIIKYNELGYLLKDDRYDNSSSRTVHQEKHIENFDVRTKNINRPIIGQLNINSIRNELRSLHLRLVST